jgi:hypothetical protein
MPLRRRAMPDIGTCGPETKRTIFLYRGSIPHGITFEFDSGDFEMPEEIIAHFLDHFRGLFVPG